MPVSFTKLIFSAFALVIRTGFALAWARYDKFRRRAALLLILLMIPAAGALWILLELISDHLGLWWL